MKNIFCKKCSGQKIFAVATTFFTITTAIILLVAIWGIDIDSSEVVGKTVATSITLAAFSFVFFIVASFSKK